ncbi:MAG: MarR family winged helix-turn-helix transcriptional regulator [Geminicoccaceae bacterium]
MRQRLKPLGVQPRQARILDALNRMKRASQVDLAREFDVTPASMSTMTSRLIRDGLITREPNQEELRSNVLALTDQGLHLLEAIYVVWREVDRDIEEAIGFKKARDLGRLTLDLRNALGGRTPGGEVWRKDAVAHKPDRDVTE